MVTHPPSLPQAFVDVLQRTPDKRFVRFEGRDYSYAQMYDAVARVAGALVAGGLEPADRVALYLENSPSFIASYLGVLWTGGIVVPVNTRYARSEVEHIIGDAGVRLLVCDRAGQERVAGVDVERTLVLDHDFGTDLTRWAAFAAGDPQPDPVALAQTDLAVIGYTSGTTGRSKGAMLSHGNFCSNSAAVTEAWGWTADDDLLLVLPLFHMHGLGVGLHGTVMRGSSLTLHRRFDAPTVLDCLRRDTVSMFFGVPTMYARLVAEAADHPFATPPDRLRLLVSGSAPLSPQRHADVERVFGLRILERYGMTETVMNTGNPYHGERKPGSVGLPFAGVEVRIADIESGAVLSEGETGEVQLCGPNVSRGYWRNPGATQASFTADGWFKTGDLGYRDADGYYYLSGRAKELIISGGFNVYPREIEEVLGTHPAIADVAVLGLPDDDLGEIVVAAVVGNASLADISLEEVQALCRDTLASFKKPRRVYHVTELPRNALGKVQKHRLRDELLSRS
ncbi:MAG: AMP-binding protein [Trueperaceae bacterium]|nr:AMP-binding protein [Trueperaceae bacterium]